MRPATPALLCMLAMTTAASAQTVGSFFTSGQGCPTKRPLVYEIFTPGNFDLDGTTIDFFPNGLGGYLIVSAGGQLPYGNGFDLTLGDDEVSAPQNLGFTFPFPGGTTTAIDVSSNGYVYLESGTINDTRCCSGSTQFNDFRNQTASFALFGMDLHPSVGGTVWFDTATVFGQQVAYVTWDDVPEYNNAGSNTCQIQLWDDGHVTMNYDGCAALTHDTLVGFSFGNGVEDGGESDISADMPIDTGAGTGPLTLRGSGIPTIGQTFDVTLENVPSTASAAALLLGAFPVNFDLDVLGMHDCDLLSVGDIGSIPMTIHGDTASVPMNFSSTPGTAGLVIETQAAVLALGVNQFGAATSDLGTMTIGDTSPVVVRASGSNTYNSDTSSGFWSITNGTLLDIVYVELDWVNSSVSNTQDFDTDQTGMAQRFDGGDSTNPSCQGTYRNSSHITTGLDFSITPTSACDSVARQGWIGTNPGTIASEFRTLAFQFTDFNPGETFELDIDTDGGSTNGGAMAGLVVTVTMSDASVRTGELVMIDSQTSQVNL